MDSNQLLGSVSEHLLRVMAIFRVLGDLTSVGMTNTDVLSVAHSADTNAYHTLAAGELNREVDAAFANLCSYARWIHSGFCPLVRPDSCSRGR